VQIAGRRHLRDEQHARNVMTREMLSAFAILALIGSAALAANEPIVGGAAMYPSKDIVDNAVNSKDHTRCLRQPIKPSRPCRPAL
jgi:hypothetical protein